MEFATWAAVVILGAGSTGVFVWFLADFLRHPPGKKPDGGSVRSVLDDDLPHESSVRSARDDDRPRE